MDEQNSHPEIMLSADNIINCKSNEHKVVVGKKGFSRVNTTVCLLSNILNCMVRVILPPSSEKKIVFLKNCYTSYSTQTSWYSCYHFGLIAWILRSIRELAKSDIMSPFRLEFAGAHLGKNVTEPHSH